MKSSTVTNRPGCREHSLFDHLDPMPNNTCVRVQPQALHVSHSTFVDTHCHVVEKGFIEPVRSSLLD